MAEYLYRVTIDYSFMYKGEKSPVYAVAKSKEGAKNLVQRHLKSWCTVKSVCCLGERLSMNMFHGKPKKGVNNEKRL